MIKKTISLLLIQSSLMANTYIINPLVLVPRDGRPFISLSTGVTNVNSKINIKSTNYLYNNSNIEFNQNSQNYGLGIGVKNNFFNFNLTYDWTNNENINYNEFLLNYDFTIKTKRNTKFIFGTGIGMSYTTFLIDGNYIDKDNSLFVLRSGIEYNIDKHNSIDFLLEYNFNFIDSDNNVYYDGVDYYEYNIEDMNSFVFKMKYKFSY